MEAKKRLAADPRSARAAREFVAAALQMWHARVALDVVDLLTSELATNAIVHANAAFDIVVSYDHDAVRVAVRDHSTRQPKRRRAAEEDTSGRGLDLVAMLATGWGVERIAGNGKAVWFEVSG
ncbi:MAG: ATP-binding protein [Mycobacteriales bacterium]|nr:ATP-binding protein [Frankia sp.]